MKRKRDKQGRIKRTLLYIYGTSDNFSDSANEALARKVDSFLKANCPELDSDTVAIPVERRSKK
tara:strand:- start:320 stop:511 length:192 start_codon:yes stop_codon:yes gene_type:complete